MTAPQHRIIFHVDMDQFFAAVEEKLRPELKGKPVVVGHDPKGGKGRGVVSTCNYEARKYGIKSGMPIAKAWRLCPTAVFLPVNIPLYLQVSSRIMSILSSFADKFESWGIDEAFLDVSSKVRNYEEAKQLALQIRKEIHEREDLTCSIGIGPNKLVAKIASDMQKPDGLTMDEEKDVKAFLEPLDIDKLLWVGKKTARKMNALGIRSIGDLARYDPSVLAEKFGVMGTQLYLYAHGLDSSEVGFKGEVKSIGRNITFEKDTSDWDFVLKVLDKLSEEVHKEAKENNVLFKTVTITVRYENFETHTHSKTLPFLTNRLEDFKKTAHELMQPYLRPERKIRLVGARVSSLVSAEKQTRLI
ncbi:MAG TPA: DNA polymerase IV [Candidatus Bathyarchaeia archaeon]|nr:DNA polymerase IV [Candidatus Bathyarchaeia archaeon]